MVTIKQLEASKRNIKKAQKTWRRMSTKERSLSQPKGRNRTKPGVKGTGEFYHVVVRPKEQFKTFRTQVLGEGGHSERVSGLRENGTWATQKWLIRKSDAHVDSRGYLKSDRSKTVEILKKLGSVPRRFKGDVFHAKPHKNIPAKDKPTEAQKKAWAENIQKAREAKKRIKEMSQS